ncbi:hypothetical protein [Nocardia wallacei]|uniref:Uncharacterized protein n=1 Tax=Nocardia wallacei TaxID=480035 RepID=A0A7G1KW88_9NOCA|nr:hypothetical protein [Nocardia wallacei]BCK57404.1 hypothetical protein NWFMUON74_51760 [Nocardia wallacei]
MTATGKSGDEVAALEAEYQRLDAVWDVLRDMGDAAHDISEAKEFRNDRFERDRYTYALEARQQVGSESRAAWDRLLVTRYGEARAAEIRAEAKAAVAQQLAEARERCAARDGRRSR